MLVWAENLKDDWKDVYFISEHISMYLAYFMQVA